MHAPNGLVDEWMVRGGPSREEECLASIIQKMEHSTGKSMGQAKVIRGVEEVIRRGLWEAATKVIDQIREAFQV